MTLSAQATHDEVDWHYPVYPDRYDEARDPSGNLRPHWRYVVEALQALGRGGLSDRLAKASRLLRDDGATYARGSAGYAQSWQLDPIPFLIDSETWVEAEQGLTERSELFDLLLRDLYSEQALLRSGIVPSEIILSSPGFLRMCHRALQADTQQLHLHGVDLARDASGALQVLGDRTQAPSGAGYALLNRTVMSRILPSVLRDAQVHRLAVFFQTLRRHFATVVDTDNPRIVMLTPGAFNETYFEHSYLANYLGYALVQGSDLVVRDGCVWMRTVEGLHRVDVIIRRVDDIWCDPVELRGDSQLGVPGLVEVVRAGNVVLANPLGSGVLENPALLRYMDAIGQFYLGRKPRLPSVQTWWLGHPDDLGYVLANLSQCVIKPVHRGKGGTSIFAQELSSTELERLRHTIQAHPKHYVAQMANIASAAPTWHQQQLCSLPSILRTFAVADQGSYCVMAGGLTRTAGSLEQAVVSNQAGATSKDTWVLASEPQSQATLRTPAGLPVATDDFLQSVDIPRRVIENIFWLGRYAERAEASARLLRTVILQLHAVTPMHPMMRLRLLCGLTDLTATRPGFYRADTDHSPLEPLAQLLCDTTLTGSLPSNIQAMLHCAEEVRELLSADTQRVLSDIRDQQTALSALHCDSDPVVQEEALDGLVTSLMAFGGLTQESMPRELGWRFLEVGRHLERALLTVILVRSTLVPVIHSVAQEQLSETLLLASETLTAYRRRQTSGYPLEHVLSLLLLDEANPRSVLYQANALAHHLEGLEGGRRSIGLPAAQRALLQGTTALRLASVTKITERNDAGYRDQLDALLANVELQLSQCALDIADAHFEALRAPQQLFTTLVDQSS